MTRFFLIFIAYSGLAILGMMLAVPPIYAAPVWPAAGVATLGLTLCGVRFWPAVWLAALSSDLIHKTLIGEAEPTLTLCATVALTATGAVLQALLAARFLQPLRTTPILAHGARIVTLLVCAAPVTCLLSASVGLLAMFLFQDLQPEMIGGNWLAWWTADAIGVLLAIPLLPLFSGRRHRWRRDLWQTCVLPLLVAGLLGTGFVLLAQWEQSEHQKQLNHDSEIIHEYLEEYLWRQQQAVAALADFLNASDEVNAESMARFSDRVLREGWLHALAWAPRVSHAEREGFESHAREAGLYQAFTQYTPEGQPQHAAVQDTYYPFHYVAQRTGRSQALGYDLASDPENLDAMQYAQENGQPTLIERHAPYDVDATRDTDWRLFIPVYRAGLSVHSATPQARTKALRGFAVGVIYLDELTAWLSPEAERRGLQYRLEYQSLWHPPQILVDTRAPAANNRAADWHNHLESLGTGAIKLDTWAISPWQPATSVPMIAFVLGGTLVMLFASSFVITSTNQRERIGHQVISRTAALKRAHRDIEDLLDNLRAYVAELTPMGYLVRANRTARERLGLRVHELSGVPLLDSYWFAQRPAAEQAWITPLLQQALEGQEIRRDVQLIAADGQLCILDLALTPILDTNGTLLKVIASAVDITARKQLEEKLLQHEALLQRVIDGSQIGYWELYPGTRQLTLGGRWAALLGYTNAELSTGSESLLALTHPEDRPRLRKALARHLDNSDPIFLIDIRVRSRSGEWLWTRLRGNMITSDALDQTSRVAGIVTDIDTLKKTELALTERGQELVQLNQDLEDARQVAERANQAKSDFLANMSHEIRTPLNGVIGMLDVLSHTELQSNQQEMLELSRSSAFSLLDVINDILDFSKIEAGKLELELQPLTLSEVVEQTCDLLDHSARSKRTELLLYTDPKLPDNLLGDSLRIRQILLNLISNAIKFSSLEGKGRVSVRALLENETRSRVSIELRISDNGIGMDSVQQARLFQPFTQADASISRRFGGSGLGLSICQHLLGLMGGSLEVESSLGEGTTFHVHLPLQYAEQPGTPSSAEFDLSDLHCVMIGASTLAQDLVVYLVHAGASVQQVEALPALRALSRTSGAPYLWIIENGDAPPPLEALRAAMLHWPGHQIRLLTVERGIRRNPRLVTPDHLMIDGNVLKRRTFLQAVTQAANYNPIPAHQAALAPVPQRPRLAPRHQHLRLLVAEDNEVNQKVILYQLDQLGYVADVVSDGQAALERLQMSHYDLLLTDLQMPRLDGYKLAAAIRALPAQQLPIIALTANAQKGEAERCKAAGMDDYLSKPVQLDALEAILAHWLNSRSSDEATVCASEQPGPALFDVGVLEQLVGAEPELVHELLQEFQDKGQQLCQQILSDGQQQRFDALAAGAHTLKSSARTVGALKLGECCDTLERLVHRAERQTLEASLRTFEAVSTKTFQAIDAKKQRS